MNTPPQRRRHVPPVRRDLGKDSLFVGMIADREISSVLADILTGFVFLEERMASVLAVLLGARDDVAATYVLRAIKSPSGRIDVMKELLEKAPINKKLGDEYDEIIREFRAISTQRNLYAHGRWWTDIRKDEVLLDDTEDRHDPLHQVRVVTAEELEAWRERILNLNIAIGKGPEEELKKRQLTHRLQRTRRAGAKTPNRRQRSSEESD